MRPRYRLHCIVRGRQAPWVTGQKGASAGLLQYQMQHARSLVVSPRAYPGLFHCQFTILSVRHEKGTRLKVNGCEAKVMTGRSVKAKQSGAWRPFCKTDKPWTSRETLTSVHKPYWPPFDQSQLAIPGSRPQAWIPVCVKCAINARLRGLNGPYLPIICAQWSPQVQETI